MKTRKVKLSAAMVALMLTALPFAAVADTGNVNVYGNVNVEVSSLVNNVPEPDTLLLIGLGAAAIWIARRIKK